jgi:hypothetical protein
MCHPRGIRNSTPIVKLVPMPADVSLAVIST